jgi:hypothetical protein
MLFRPSSRYHRINDNSPALHYRSVYGDGMQLAQRSVGRLPVDDKLKRLRTSHSLDFKTFRDVSGLPQGLVTKQYDASIPPPKPSDRLKQKLVPVEPPKFLRDSMRVDDIDGATPKKYFTRPVKNIMQCRDIEGAYPKKKRWHYKDYAFDDYSDVTKKRPKLLFGLGTHNSMEMYK